MFKRLVSIMGFLALGLGLGGALTTDPLTASAASKSTMTAFPKVYRHTWYHYSQGHYETVTFGAKRVSGLSYFGGAATKYVAHLHAHKLTTTKLKQHPSWSTAVNATTHRVTWLNVRGWNQIMGAGDFYKVMTKSVAGKQHQVLSQAGGAGVWTDAHYYRSKAIAKQLGNRHFTGERYY